ncbi:MAG: hypothetical protein NVSMB5_14780 [Candidatus Velthaea sp.]
MNRTPLFAFVLALAGTFAGAFSSASAADPIAIGQSAPAFTYRLLNGHQLLPKTLHGHPYVLWMVASWCSSCEAGSSVVGEHIDYLRDRGVSVVEMRLAKDLGAPGPGLQTFQKAVGKKSASPNWFWGELTDKQTLVLDPKGYPDIYYLIDADGKVSAINGNPATTWDQIAGFAASAKPSAQVPTNHKRRG